MEPKDAIAMMSVLVALTALISTIFFAWINYRRERLNQRIQFFNLRQQYFAALRAWSDLLSDVLSEAIHLAELDPKRCGTNTFFERRNKLRVAISSMIDKGRWFFTNLHTDGHQKMFQGYRNEVLNSLVWAYDTVTVLNYVDGKGNDILREKLVDAKKQFTKQIQGGLNPLKRDEEFHHITNAVD